jgi:hypothetical protein
MRIKSTIKVSILWMLVLITPLESLSQRLDLKGRAEFNINDGDRFEVVQSSSGFFVYQFQDRNLGQSTFDNLYFYIHQFDSILQHVSTNSFSFRGRLRPVTCLSASYNNELLEVRLRFKDQIVINDSIIYINGFFDTKDEEHLEIVVFIDNKGKYIRHNKPTRPAVYPQHWQVLFPEQDLVIETYADNSINPFIPIGLICKKTSGETLWSQLIPGIWDKNSFYSFEDRIAVKTLVSNSRLKYYEINLSGETIFDIEIPVTVNTTQSIHKQAFVLLDTFGYLTALSDLSNYVLIDTFSYCQNETDLWLIEGKGVKSLCSIENFISNQLNVYGNQIVVLGETIYGSKKYCEEPLWLSENSSKQPAIVLFSISNDTLSKPEKPKNDLFDFSPNPVSSTLSISFKKQGTFTLQIFNNLSQLVHFSFIEPYQKVYEYKVDDLTPGLYYLRLTDSTNESEIAKMIVH